MSTGTPAIVPRVIRKYFSVRMSAVGDGIKKRRRCRSLQRERGDASEMSSIATSSPRAFSVNHRRLGSAAVHRNTSSPSRVTVPSSMTLP